MALTPRLPRPFDSPCATPTTPAAQPTTPSAAEANEAIRALVDARAGEDWTSVESAAYEVLLIEWAAATRGLGSDIIEAA
ncbi:hypothetical protein ACTU45_04275 [Streptomyces sp. 24-1644]|uniref:hypothetical protein n=1 Tax=unclassified Streptomyces TaxID=2593676 RepID=UPI00364F45CF